MIPTPILVNKYRNRGGKSSGIEGGYDKEVWAINPKSLCIDLIITGSLIGQSLMDLLCIYPHFAFFIGKNWTIDWLKPHHQVKLIYHHIISINIILYIRFELYINKAKCFTKIAMNTIISSVITWFSISHFGENLVSNPSILICCKTKAKKN